MGHAHVRNQTLYQDRTVQDWHFDTFSADCWAIDVDLMGCCKACGEPLYLIEATTNPEKPTRLLMKLAVRAEVPALLILHQDARITGGRVIYSPMRPTCHDRLRDQRHVYQCIAKIRRAHICAKRGAS